MDTAESALRKLIDRHLPSPSHLEMTAARDGVLDRLRSKPAHLQKARIADGEPSVSRWSPVMSAAAAAAAVAAVVGTSILWPASDATSYRVVDGTVQSGKAIRTNGGAGAVLALADGSRVEMRSQSDLSLERANDGVRIRLGTGGIIVNAAKQRAGHLYVQTKDMTLAVVGTVFVVNAEERGSRVAVIEGEVRVREGRTETTLRPGEQVSTNPELVTRSVKEEIAWSRHADAHLAILATFAKGMAATAGPLALLTDASGSGTAAFGQGSAAAAGGQSSAEGQFSARPQFEEASIRTCDPDNVPAPPPGARGGGANSFQMTPGRTHALCMTLATIIRHAYGFGPAGADFLNPGGRNLLTDLNTVYGLGVEDGRRVRGGPDWVRSERFTIDAVADGAPDAATMSGPMLRDLLERRVQLKAHIETEQVPAFALTVAPGGLKMKPVEAGACTPIVPGAVVRSDGFIETPPGVQPTGGARSLADVRRGEKPTCGLWPQRDGSNTVIVGGGVTPEALARLLGASVGRVRVFDRTGVTDKFNFVLEHEFDPTAPGFGRPQAATEPSDVPRAAPIFAALEQQLGLRLEPARAPREFIVIDQVERPAAN